MKEITLHISGMSCQHCVKAVSEALMEAAGVHNVKVSLEEEKAWVQYDEVHFELESAKNAVAEQGYKVTGSEQ